MFRKSRLLIVPAISFAFFATTWASQAQEPKSTIEKIKEKASSAAGTVKKGFVSAGDAIKNQYLKARSDAVALGIQGRVIARLHWDKHLIREKIETHAPKEGVIELAGSVSDAKLKSKAVEIANDTFGVNEVIDHITVSAAEPAGETKAVEPAKP